MEKIKKLKIDIIGDNQIWESICFKDVPFEVMTEIGKNITDFVKELKKG